MIELVNVIRRPGFHSLEKTPSGWRVSARHSEDPFDSIISTEGNTVEEAIKHWMDCYRESLIRGISYGLRKRPHDDKLCLRSRKADRPITFEELKELYNYWWVSLSEKDRAPTPQDLENGCVILTSKSLDFLQERDQWRKEGLVELTQMTFDFLEDPEQYFAD